MENIVQTLWVVKEPNKFFLVLETFFEKEFTAAII